MSSASASVAPSWEAQKENAAPLERGRNVATLGLRHSDVDREDLDRKVRHYESLVSPSEDPNITEMDNDPLADWLSYIKFYQNSFPSDTRDNFLIIERCVRALAKMKQYSNDDRFVSVCAKYADKTKDPGQVFKYLHSQKIGAHVAIFWIAWAFVAEKDSDYPFAEQIFKKGMSKKAEPLQMLKLRHHQFQRRMSRHWLNSSKANDQLNDEYDEGERNRSSRSTLGGLSSDRLRRNDRSQHRARQGSSVRRQNSGRRFGANQSNTGGSNPKGAFSIFVEEEGENAYNLDQEYADNDRAVIARESDRKKENLAAAERWNERGGIQRSYHKSTALAPRSKTPLPAFSVFVDEECAAKNEREEQEQQVQNDRQRQVRDERTFRERDNEGMAEKIFRDPTRYLKDPNRYKSEIVSDNHTSEDPRTEKAKAERKSRAGFNKRLLKDERGKEQCFEEARAKAGAYKELEGSSMNFNELHRTVSLNQSSKMSFDSGRDTSMDISMSESVSGFVHQSTDTTQPFGNRDFQAKNNGKKLFQNLDESFGAGLNQTAISHASSTVNEIDVACSEAIGKKQEDETINTKFAMRELSMMFSSPALGAHSARKRLNRSNASRIDESLTHAGKADTSFGNVGDGLLLDNSICNVGGEEPEDGRRPFAEFSSLKKLKDGDEAGKSGGNGFVIFQDDSSVGASQSRGSSRPAGGAFQIFDEANEESSQPKIEESVKKKTGTGFQFQIYDEGNVEDEHAGVDSKLESGDTASISDAIALLDDKLEINDSNSSSSDEESQGMYNGGKSENILQSGFQFQIYDEGNGDNDRSKADDELENGDTASISDALAILDKNMGNADSDASSSDEESQQLAIPGDETATMSLFNEIFQDKVEEREDDVSASNGGRNRRNLTRDLLQRNAAVSVVSKSSRERLKRSYYEVGKTICDYNQCISESIERALNETQRNSSNPDLTSPFRFRLLRKRRTFHFPRVALPKQLRKKNIAPDTNVSFGKYGGLLLKKELGQGTFGRVILVDSTDSDSYGTIAIKVQSPTHSLAWEFLVLQRLQQRLIRNAKKSHNYAFPKPISFISLGDGGILSMSAVSETGFNLVDLSNFYRLKLGKCVPELLAFHYTSVALRIIEQLHSKGNILHCDVKPDNFVLSNPKSCKSTLHSVNFSDLALVDFGNAVDLAEITSHRDHENVSFCGIAARKDMQCIAMRDGQSWSHDADTFGVLCCAHVLLYGTHMELKKVGDRWAPSSSLKRYWKVDLWKEIFDTLLAPDHSSRLTSTSRGDRLCTLRQKIDSHLDVEAESVQYLLSRQANILPDSRKKIQ